MTESGHDAVGALLGWFRREGADLPWRRTRDRWAVLVAEAQLQATPVARVAPVLRAVHGALADARRRWRPSRSGTCWRPGTAWATRGGPATSTPRPGPWPSAAGRPPSGSRSCPGVGPYTAAALRCFADGEPVLPVDTNVRRVLARRFPGGWPGTPEGEGWAAGQALMDLGRLWCTARAPRCGEGCPVRAGCPSAGVEAALAATPPGRRQGRYEGSMRQRRGVLLGALAEAGEVAVARDPEAAASLVAEGLAGRRGRLLVPAGG